MFSPRRRRHHLHRFLWVHARARQQLQLTPAKSCLSIIFYDFHISVSSIFLVLIVYFGITTCTRTELPSYRILLLLFFVQKQSDYSNENTVLINHSLIFLCSVSRFFSIYNIAVHSQYQCCRCRCFFAFVLSVLLSMPKYDSWNEHGMAWKKECETKDDCNKKRETQKQLQWQWVCLFARLLLSITVRTDFRVISLHIINTLLFSLLGWVRRYKRRFALSIACAYTATKH